MPVLFVTERQEESFYRRNVSIGGISFLSKPTRRQELTTRVAEILKNAGGPQERQGEGSG